MPKTVYLLVDYREHFFASTRLRGASICVSELVKWFSKNGVELVTKQFSEIDFRGESYRDKWVIYQSSEDRDCLYKDYIEDVLLGLHLQGARLVPGFEKFRAHHNKVFMEILRDVKCPDVGKTIRAYGYGTVEEFHRNSSRHDGSVVIKPAAGALSAGVKLARTDREKLSCAAKISSSFHLFDWLKDLGNRILLNGYKQKSFNRQRFVVQEFIPGLIGDYKVLVYGDKYYVLHREVRKGDFRASGSGMFSYPDGALDSLLDFCHELFVDFDVPFMSLDVAEANGVCQLIEFQFISFGNYTLEKSDGYFTRTDSGWNQVEESPNLEREVANSTVAFIERQERACSAGI